MISLGEAQGMATVAAGVAGWGAAALGWVRTRVRVAEAVGYGLAAGAGMMTAAAWVLGLAGAQRRGWVTAVAAAGVAAGVWWGRRVEIEEEKAGGLAAAMLAVVGLLGWTVPGMWRPALGARGPLWGAARVFGGEAGPGLLHCACALGLAAAVYAVLERRAGVRGGAVGAVVGGVVAATNPAALAYAARGEAELLWAWGVVAAVGCGLRWGRMGWVGALGLAAAAGAGWPGGREWTGPLLPGLPWAAAPVAAMGWGWLVRRERAAAVVLVAFHAVSSVAAPEPMAGLRATERQARREAAALVHGGTPAGAVVLAEVDLDEGATGRRMAPAEWFEVMRAACIEEERAARVKVIRVEGVGRRRIGLPGVGWKAEIRFYRGKEEVARRPEWRMRRTAGEGRASEGFDNSVVTGCRCAVEVDFGEDVWFDSVRVWGRDGVPVEVPAGLRQAARGELRRRGVTHVVVRAGSGVGADVGLHGEYWGLRERGQAGGAVLYEME